MRPWPLWTGRSHRALGVLFVAVLRPGIAAAGTARVLTSIPASLPHVTFARRGDTGPGPLRLRGAGGRAMWIMVHGEESDAVTLAWEKVDGAECYEVQLKSGDKPDAEFATVSDKLSSTMVSVRAMPPTWLQRRLSRGRFAYASCVRAHLPTPPHKLPHTHTHILKHAVYGVACQVRKKNLQPSSVHQVRVRAKNGDSWGDFSDPVSCSTLNPDAKRIDAPSVYIYIHSACVYTVLCDDQRHRSAVSIGNTF